MKKIKVTTRFDVTATGITGHFKLNKIPFLDQVGNKITDQVSWDRSRNQQRNYETLLQLLSLRTQIFDVSLPVENNSQWSFDFTIESAGVFGEDENFSVLCNDADGIPMLRQLDNDSDVDAVLITQGARQNIWFEQIPINNTLENTDG